MTINDLELTERLIKIIETAHKAQKSLRNGTLPGNELADIEDQARKAGYRVNDLIAWRKQP